MPLSPLTILLSPTLAAALLSGSVSAAEPAPPSPESRFDREPANVRVVRSREGRVVLRSSDDGDPETWEGILEASHFRNGSGVAYAVRVRLAGEGGPRTLSLRLLDHVPPLAARCGSDPPPPGAAEAGPPLRRLRRPGDAMAFYRCALDRCFSRAGRCHGSGAETGDCLAARCRGELQACLVEALGCG